MGTTADKLAKLSTTKNKIKNALIYKKAPVSDSEPFESYADKIENLNIERYVRPKHWLPHNKTDGCLSFLFEVYNPIYVPNAENKTSFMMECEGGALDDVNVSWGDGNSTLYTASQITASVEMTYQYNYDTLLNPEYVTELCGKSVMAKQVIITMTSIPRLSFICFNTYGNYKNVGKFGNALEMVFDIITDNELVLTVHGILDGGQNPAINNKLKSIIAYGNEKALTLDSMENVLKGLENLEAYTVAIFASSITSICNSIRRVVSYGISYVDCVELSQGVRDYYTVLKEYYSDYKWSLKLYRMHSDVVEIKNLTLPLFFYGSVLKKVTISNIEASTSDVLNDINLNSVTMNGDDVINIFNKLPQVTNGKISMIMLSAYPVLKETDIAMVTQKGYTVTF